MQRLPWWAGPAAQGLVPAVLVFVLVRVQDDLPPALGVVAAGACALLAGGLEVAGRRRERRRLVEELGPASDEELRRVGEVVRGAAPRDDRERELASWLASRRSAGPAGVRRFLTTTGLLLLTVVLAVRAVQDPPWWWPGVVLLAVATATAGRGDPVLRRRAAELRAPVG